MLKRKNTPVNKTTQKNSNTLNITYITDSTRITADMFCENDVRIAGSVNGKVECKKKVMLAETGTIEGTVISQVADISGKVKGDIKTSDSLILRSTAKIDGQIFTKKLTIEDGAQVTGAFKVGPKTSTDNPKNASHSDKKSSS